jgi:hypothetical protein
MRWSAGTAQGPDRLGRLRKSGVQILVQAHFEASATVIPSHPDLKAASDRAGYFQSEHFPSQHTMLVDDFEPVRLQL